MYKHNLGQVSALQTCLDELVTWSEIWGMDFTSPCTWGATTRRPATRWTTSSSAPLSRRGTSACSSNRTLGQPFSVQSRPAAQIQCWDRSVDFSTTVTARPSSSCTRSTCDLIWNFSFQTEGHAGEGAEKSSPHGLGIDRVNLRGETARARSPVPRGPQDTIRPGADF